MTEKKLDTTIPAGSIVYTPCTTGTRSKDSCQCFQKGVQKLGVIILGICKQIFGKKVRYCGSKVVKNKQLCYASAPIRINLTIVTQVPQSY